MMRRRLLTTLAILAGLCTGAFAQDCGPTNPNCLAPTPPNGDNSNRIATTAFVNNFSGGGGGGDPLNLVHGFNLTTTDPTGNIGLTFSAAARVSASFQTVSTLLGNQFNEKSGLAVDYVSNYGDYSFGPGGGGPTAKTTEVALALTNYAIGVGQKFGITSQLSCYSMGDCFHQGAFSNFETAPLSGDEGVGFTAVESVNQNSAPHQNRLSAIPTKSGINTTVNATFVVPNSTPTIQTLTVVSNAGASVNDWVVVDDIGPTIVPNLEAVQLTGVGTGCAGGSASTSICGWFRYNHAIGATVLPATLITGSDSCCFNYGQHRVIVNMSQGSALNTPVYAGTISSTSGATINGTGTSWSAGMVGGTAPYSVGSISFAADDFGAAINACGTTLSVSGAASSGSTSHGNGLIRLTVPSMSGSTCFGSGGNVLQYNGYYTGNSLYVVGVKGTVEANGYWTMFIVDDTHIDLIGSVFTNAYTSGGTVEDYVVLRSWHQIVSVSSSTQLSLFIPSVAGLIGYSGRAGPFTIGGVANNGSGLFRLTLSNAGSCGNSSTNTGCFNTGTNVTVAGTSGAAGLNGIWVVTVIDANHIDLQGSTFASGYTSGGTVQIAGGRYQIRPSCEHLTLTGFTSVCSPSTSTWAVNDVTEFTIPPAPDYTGRTDYVAISTNGGTYRAAYNFVNLGPRTIQTGIGISNPRGLSGPQLIDQDFLRFGTGIVVVAPMAVGLQLGQAQTAAIQLCNALVTACYDNSGKISWGTEFLTVNTGGTGLAGGGVGGLGMQIEMTDGSAVGGTLTPTNSNFQPGGVLTALAGTGQGNSSWWDKLMWNGFFQPTLAGNSASSLIPTCNTANAGEIAYATNFNGRFTGQTVTTFNTGGGTGIIACNNTSWVVLGGGALGSAYQINNQTGAGGSYTPTTNDVILQYTGSGSGFTFNLPQPAAATLGQIYIIKNAASVSQTVNVGGGGVYDLDGSLTNKTVSQYNALRVYSSGDGTNWYTW
jgi:hypothetical protein